jgi:hypothetical protein
LVLSVECIDPSTSLRMTQGVSCGRGEILLTLP